MIKKISFLFLLAALAVPAAAKAETVNPQKSLQEAYDLIGKQEFDKALVILNRVIAMNFKSAPAYFNRGMIFLGKNYTDQALTDFEEAVRIDSRFAPAYMAKAKVYFSQEKLAPAIAELDKAVRADRKFGLAYYNRALAYEKQGKFERAFNDLKKAKLYGVPVSDEELEDLWTRGHVDEIIADAEEAVRKNPELGDGYYDLGVAYYHKKEYAKSLENFEKAKKLGVEVDAGLLKEIESLGKA